VIVNVGGIEKVDAALEARAYHTLRGGLVDLGTEGHGAEAGSRDNQIGASQRECLHQSIVS
jgi:hypothetical protein